MSIEREEASPALVGPDFDFVVVPPRHEKWLRFVEINTSYRAIVLLEAVYQCTHAIVP